MSQSAPFNKQLLVDMLLNDLVDEEMSIEFRPGNARCIAVGNDKKNEHTYFQLFEIAKFLSTKLNAKTMPGQHEIGKIGVNEAVYTDCLSKLNMKMVKEVLEGFFKKFGCNFRLRENHAALEKEPKLKIKVVWL